MSLVKVATFALPLLLILCTYESDTKPLFGLGTLLSAITTDLNGTSLVEALALAHAEHTINKIGLLADLFGLGSNLTLLSLGI